MILTSFIILKRNEFLSKKVLIRMRREQNRKGKKTESPEFFNQQGNAMQEDLIKVREFIT